MTKILKNTHRSNVSNFNINHFNENSRCGLQLCENKNKEALQPHFINSYAVLIHNRTETELKPTDRVRSPLSQT